MRRKALIGIGWGLAAACAPWAGLAASARAAVAGAAPVLLVLGDSWSAEYGLQRDTGWVSLLSDRLARDKLQYSVVNASVSGETSAGGRTRLPALLTQQRPAVVVIALGGNDALRGLPLKTLADNLTAMITASQKAGARVLLVGMRIPPNYGREFAQRFEQTFADVARATRVPLVPFMLAGLETRDDLFQPDRIHPTAAAQPLMLERVWPQLAPLLARR